MINSVEMENMKAIPGLGGRVAKFRKLQSKNQEQFAEKLGISVGYLSKIENDKVGIGLSTLVSIAVELNVPLDYLVFGELKSCSIAEQMMRKANSLSDEHISFLAGVVDLLFEIELQNKQIDNNFVK